MNNPTNPIPGSEWSDDSAPPSLPRLSVFEVLSLLGKAAPVELDTNLEQSIYDDIEWEGYGYNDE